MLVVTARWGIGDGTVHVGPRATAIEAFFSDLRRAAWRAGFRRDGSYRPIDAVQVVFAGETLDGLGSLAWCADVRPWRNGPRVARAQEAVAAGVARSGRRVWRHLRRGLRGGLPVPAADRRGRPVLGTVVAASTTVCCVVGPRERPLEATSIAAMALRAGIRIGVTADAATEPVGPMQERPPTLVESWIVDAVVPFVVALRGARGDNGEVASWLHRLALAPIADAPLIVRAWHAQTGDGTLDETWRRALGKWVMRSRIDPPAVPVSFDAVAAVADWLEQATREPATPLPADLTGLGLQGPASPPSGSLPLIVTSDDTLSGMTTVAWPTPFARSQAVLRIGAAPEDPRIVDAA